MRAWPVVCLLFACGPAVDDDPGGGSGSGGGDESGGGSSGALPAACDDPPYDEACEEAFADRCAERSDEASCEATEALPGGLSLRCLWLEPQTVVDAEACTLEPAPARCVGVAYPGDIGCAMYSQDGEDVLVTVPEACFIIGWGDCTLDDSPPACACAGL